MNEDACFHLNVTFLLTEAFSDLGENDYEPFSSNLDAGGMKSKCKLCHLDSIILKCESL